MNTNVVSRSLAVASVLLAAAPAQAEQYGPFEVVGFLKNEYSLCDNCSAGLVNRSAYDPRGVLSPPVPMVNQGGDSEETGRNLFLAQLTLGVSHEFDNAVKIEAKTSGRMRNSRRGHLRQLDDGPLRRRVAPDLRLAAGRQDDLPRLDAIRLLRLSGRPVEPLGRIGRGLRDLSRSRALRDPRIRDPDRQDPLRGVVRAGRHAQSPQPLLAGGGSA